MSHIQATINTFSIQVKEGFTIPTSSGVVSEEQIRTSSEEGRDCVVSCMYKDSTVPRMSSDKKQVVKIEKEVA